MTNKFDLETTVKSFISATGSGALMGKNYLAAINHVIASDDTTVILRMAQRCKARGDAGAYSAVLNTFSKIYVGTKINKKGGKVVGLRIKDATLSNSAVEALHTLVNGKISMRGTNWKAAFKTEAEQEAAKFDAQKWAVAQVKKNGSDNLDVMIAALQALR